MTDNHLVTISSINYYVPNIETIEVTSSTQDIKIYNSDDFEIIDNTLVLQLKEIDNEKDYRITKITEKCNLSDKEKCSQLQLLPIGKNEDYDFEVDTFYTIPLDDDDDNNVNNKKETEIDISFKFGNPFAYIIDYIFFDNKNMKNCKWTLLFGVVCTYKTEKKSSKISVNYNENTQKSKDIYFITYKFPSKNQCQVTSNPQNIPIYISSEGPIDVYFENNKLTKLTNNDNYNYEIDSSYLSSGIHYINLAEEGKNEKQEMSNMKIEIYNEYNINSIYDSNLKEGKISELIITFNEELSSVPYNFLLIKDSNKEIYSNQCNLSENNKKVVTCKFDLSSVLSGTYKLSYLNQCGKYTEYNDITIKDNLSLNLIHPSYIYLEKVDYYTNIKFIFSREFDNNNLPTKIEFIKDNYKLSFNKFKISIIINFFKINIRRMNKI